MRKRIVKPGSSQNQYSGRWLDLEQMAEVEITSETEDCPIESALLTHQGSGWRAAEPGRQVIRIRFDKPLSVKRIRLVFEEKQVVRTQEFTLSWSRDGGISFQQILRQQYNFAPPSATEEIEDYCVDLADVTELELSIVPDVSGGSAVASLAQLRLA